jgi:beta-xylosidase
MNIGKKHTEETKKKISEYKKQWQQNRTPDERKHTEETKQLLSIKAKGRIITEEQRKKMSEAKKNFLNSLTPDELLAYKTKLANSRKKNL